jgi:hypothetical protein
MVGLDAVEDLIPWYRAGGRWDDLLTLYNLVIYHGTDRDRVVDAYLQKGLVLARHLGRPAKARQHFGLALELGGATPVQELISHLRAEGQAFDAEVLRVWLAEA